MGDKIDLINETLEKIQKHKGLLCGELPKIAQKMACASLAMYDAGLLFSAMLREIGLQFPGDVGGVITDFGGYSGDINDIFKQLNEKLRYEFNDCASKTSEALTKEISDKIKEIQTKRLIYAKEIRQTEKQLKMATKSQNEAQILAATREVYQKQDELERYECSVLHEIYAIQRRSGISLIEKILDYSKIFSVFGDHITLLKPEFQRWHNVCSIKDGLTAEQQESLIPNLCSDTDTVLILENKHKATTVDTYVSLRDQRMPLKLQEINEDSPLSPRRKSKKESKNQQTVLPSQGGVSTGISAPTLPTLPTSLTPEDSTQIEISWPSEVRHRPLSEIAAEWRATAGTGTGTGTVPVPAIIGGGGVANNKKTDDNDENKDLHNIPPLSLSPVLQSEMILQQRIVTPRSEVGVSPRDITNRLLSKTSIPSFGKVSNSGLVVKASPRDTHKEGEIRGLGESTTGLQKGDSMPVITTDGNHQIMEKGLKSILDDSLFGDLEKEIEDLLYQTKSITNLT
eukprot:TRINITY_DN5165_c0_g1_i1.p1 TRINITY_DN5165_c0_g1~~TRINITY_DN5165_c0_g1_i1.p1  ORF type:complete len:513 (+),score=96.64 TRINITY_DN5165_c0_g1_i1:3-1541(+)